MTAAAGPDGIRPGDRAGRRYLGLWLPTFPLDRIERRLPAVERALARATVAEAKGALRLVAVNRAAAALGLSPGLPLADARARHPALAVVPAAPAADASLLGRLADAGERYTPLIACDGPDGLMLDVTGCAHLFGGERELVRDLLARLRKAGFAARAALAATAGAAFAFARFGAAPAVVVPAGEALGPLLAPLPVAALRLDATIVEGLARLGLRRIGDLVDKPRAPLAARFGARVLRRLEEALGAAPSALAYRVPPPAFCAERRLMEPVERVEDVLGLAGHLAASLAVPLEQREVGARRLDLVLFRVDGRMTRLPVGARRPLRDPDAIVRLFAEKVAALGVLDAGFGFDLIRLAVTEAAPLAARQAGFGADDDAAAVDGLIDRLAIRFGPGRVRRLVCADHHLPEAAGLSVAAQGWSPSAAVPPDRGARARPERRRAEGAGAHLRAFIPDQVDTWDARDGSGPVVRMHAGPGDPPEAAAPEQAGAGDALHAGSGSRSAACLAERAVAGGAETGTGWIIPMRAGPGGASGSSLARPAGAGGGADAGVPVRSGSDGVQTAGVICSGEQSGVCLSEAAGAGPIIPIEAGCGGRRGTLKQTGACDGVVPAHAGAHSEMLLPAAPSPGGVEAGERQVAPMCDDSGAVRVEDGPEAAIPPVLAVSSFPGRLLPPGRIGSDGRPVPPEGMARGRILPFPATAVRLPHAAARPAAPPAPERLGLLPDTRPASSAAGTVEEPVPVRSMGKAVRLLDAAVRPAAPPAPERLGRLPDAEPVSSAAGTVEESPPARSMGEANRGRDAAARPAAPPASERLGRLPDAGSVSPAAGTVEAPVPVRSMGKVNRGRDAAVRRTASPGPERLERLPDAGPVLSAAGPIEGPVPVRSMGEANRGRGAAACPEAPPEPERLGQLPDARPVPSAAGTVEKLVPVRSMGETNRGRDAAARRTASPGPERLGRLPDARPVPSAAGTVEKPVPVRSMGEGIRLPDTATRPAAPPASERLGGLPDAQPVSSAAGPIEAPVPAHGDPEGADICGAARPLRLFAPPEPVEAVAEVPDGPPLRFRWRRRLHRVIRVEGPERIDGAWWAGDVRPRDYFRVETEEGCRFWLFRTDPPERAPAASPRPPGAGDGRTADRRAEHAAATDASALALPRPKPASSDCPRAFSLRETGSAPPENTLGQALPQGGRPGIWFLHGVLG